MSTFSSIFAVGYFFCRHDCSSFGSWLLHRARYYGTDDFIVVSKNQFKYYYCYLVGELWALAGANFITSQSGVIFRELISGAGVANDNTFTYGLGIFAATFLMPVVLLGIYSSINAKSSKIAIQTRTRNVSLVNKKKSIMLIFIMMATVLIVPISNLLIPNVDTIEFLNARII